MTIIEVAEGLSIGIRKADERDANYILKTWKEVQRQSPSMWWANDASIYKTLDSHCNKLYDSLGAMVACDPDEPSRMLGWACYDKPQGILHYIYTLSAYRKHGIARALLLPLHKPLTVTHWSRDCEWLQDAIELRYKPSIIYRSRYKPRQERATNA